MANVGGRPKRAKNHPGRCKIALCTRDSLGSRYSRLCQEHYAVANGDRGTCEKKNCKKPRILPYADGFCEEHHPGMKALTTHEKVLVQGALAKKTNKQMAAEIGVTPGTVAAKMNSPTMRAVVEAASVKTGLTTEHVMQTVFDATKAVKVMLSRDPETGEAEPRTVGPDWDMRLKACEVAAKITGMNAPTRTEAEVTTQQQVLVVLPAKQPVALNHPSMVIEAKAVGE